MSDMTRREAVRLLGLGTLAAVACAGSDDSDLPIDSDADADADADADTDSDTDSDTDVDCEPTSDDIEGPYWADGIPIRNDLDLYGHEGERIRLQLHVLDTACAPLPNAVVELWHADPDGAYDPESAEKPYYGQINTDNDGACAFSTVKPGRYLNGATYRPAHLHVKVYVEGVERLTTQLYFEDDPFNEGDPWRIDELTLAWPDGVAAHDIVV